MRKNKSVFEKNVVFFKIGKFFEDVNPLVSFNIKNYGVQNIYKAFHEDKNSLTDKEKKEFATFISDLKTSREKLDNKTELTKEEYSSFLNDLFNNLDKIDREGEATAKTAGSFRILHDLIDLLSIFGNIELDWNKKKKYCKFKYIEIIKAINSGQQPIRGNPNEAKFDEEINKEFNLLVQEDKSVKELENKENDKNIINLSQNINYAKEDVNMKVSEKKSVINPKLFIRRGGENLSVKDRRDFFTEDRNNIINNNQQIKRENGDQMDLKINNQPIIDDSENKSKDLDLINKNLTINGENSLIDKNPDFVILKEGSEDQPPSIEKKIHSSPNIHSFLEQNFFTKKEIPTSSIKDDNIIPRIITNYSDNSNEGLQPNKGENMRINSENNEEPQKDVVRENSLLKPKNDHQSHKNYNIESPKKDIDNYKFSKDNIPIIEPKDLFDPNKNQEGGFYSFHKIDPELYKINKQINMKNLKSQESKIEDPQIFFNYHPIFITKPHVNPKVFQHIKPLDFQLPIAKNSKEYQILIERVIQHIELGSSELDYRKIDFSINHIEMALYYLHSIKN